MNYGKSFIINYCLLILNQTKEKSKMTNNITIKKEFLLHTI